MGRAGANMLHDGARKNKMDVEIDIGVDIEMEKGMKKRDRIRQIMGTRIARCYSRSKER